MFARLNLTRKGLILVLVPVVFEIVLVAILASMLGSAAQDFEQLEHASDVLIAMHEFDSALAHKFVRVNDPSIDRAERARRLSSISELLQGLKFPSKRAYPELSAILEEVDDLRLQLQNIVERAQDANAGVVAKGLTVTPEQEAAIFLQAQNINREIVRLETRLRTAEPIQLEQARYLAMGWLLTGFVAGAFLSFFLAHLFASDIRSRLVHVGRNAERIATAEPLLPLHRGAADEIGDLDRSLHHASKLLQDARRKELTIIENAADIICSLDAKLRFRAVSAVVARLWRYAPEDLLGKSLLTLIAAEDLEAARSAFINVQEQGEAEIENVIVCQDGKSKNLVWKISWSATEESYFCVVHDVTELRAIERMKRHFIAIVSHDLRTPLTSVGVCLAFLLSGRRGFISDEVRKLLELARKSANRLMDLVNELLELEKFGSKKFLLNLIAVSLSDVCAAAKETLLGASEGSLVKVKGPIGDALVHADQTRLVQAVTNLLANAIRNAPPNSTVTLSIVKECQEYVKLRIHDDGPPIPAEERTSVFEKFQRSDANEFSVPLKTSGLGLALVKAIVEAHGGKVGAESDGERGRDFWITVPTYEDDEEDEL